MKKQILTALAAAMMIFAAAPGQAQDRHGDRHGGRHAETIVKLKCEGNDCRLVFGEHKRQPSWGHMGKPRQHRVYGHHWRQYQAWKWRQARKAYRHERRHDRHRNRHHGRHHGRHHEQSGHHRHGRHG